MCENPYRFLQVQCGFQHQVWIRMCEFRRLRMFCWSGFTNDLPIPHVHTSPPFPRHQELLHADARLGGLGGGCWSAEFVYSTLSFWFPREERMWGRADCHRRESVRLPGARTERNVAVKFLSSLEYCKFSEARNVFISACKLLIMLCVRSSNTRRVCPDSPASNAVFVKIASVPLPP